MIADPSSRPYAFLVSTTGGRDADDLLEALSPVLDRLGTLRRVAHPESSLAHAVAAAERAGSRPIHLAIGSLHDCYLTPAVPTVLVPLWHYPEVPAVDLNRNGRMNWARIADRADLILAPSRFTAEAFRRSGVGTTTVVLPPPPRAGWSRLPTWGPGLPVTVVVPHVTWEGFVEESPLRVSTPRPAPDLIDEPEGPPEAWSLRMKRAGKRRLRRIKPYFSNATVQRLDGYKQRLAPILGRPDPGRMLAGTASFGYRILVRRWIGERAHGRLQTLSDRLRGRGPVPAPWARCGLHPSPLTLSGLVYAATVDYHDPTTNDSDLITAFLHAFRDRADATLLVHLATTPGREADDLGRLSHAYHSPRMAHRCRVVAVSGPVGAGEAFALGRATSYRVETGRSRGWSTALVDSLASGRPAIAPAHSMYGEWVDDRVGLSYAAHPEPTSWPIDPLNRHTTFWNRLVWSDLRDRLAESAAIADDDHGLYEDLSANARERVADRSGLDAIAERLEAALEAIPARPVGSFAWA